jgi:hypothetical protein
VRECPKERPCPYVGCRYHLALYVRADGTLELATPKGSTGTKRKIDMSDDMAPIWEQLWTDNVADHVKNMSETCCLDIAKRGGLPPSTVATYAGLSKRRISQIERRALDELREQGYDGDGLMAALLRMAVDAGSV